MSNQMRWWVGVLCLGVWGCTGAVEQPAASEAALDGRQVLVYTEALRSVHASIANGVALMQTLGETHGFEVVVADQGHVFTDASLAVFDAVVFMNASGNVLDSLQRAAFQRYIERGGGYVGVHAAATVGYDWPWYEGLVGAFFEDHPALQTANINVVDPVHPATRNLPRRWAHHDEWYNFQSNPRGQVHVLMTLDERSYDGGTMGHDHPIAWAGCAWPDGRGRPR